MAAVAPARPAARTVWDTAEACLAATAFAVLCVLVLRASPYLAEPDDYAYRASIVAMTDGHFFTLSGGRHTRSPSGWHLRWAAAGWVPARVAARFSGCRRARSALPASAVDRKRVLRRSLASAGI